MLAQKYLLIIEGFYTAQSIMEIWNNMLICPYSGLEVLKLVENCSNDKLKRTTVVLVYCYFTMLH
jgi:hypothetical protein